MKKKIIFSLCTILLAIGCSVLIIILCGSKEEKKRKPELRNIKIQCIGIEDYTFDFGEYLVYDYDEGENNNKIIRMNFYVDDGLDFYNNVIKKHPLYNSIYDYQDKNTFYGFMYNRYDFIGYEVIDNYIYIDQLDGYFTIPYKVNTSTLDPFTICRVPGPINVIKKDSNDINVPSIGFFEFKISYDEIVKIYDTFSSDFIEKHDDYILIKGIQCIDDYYDQSKLNDFFVSEKHLCKISKYNDTVRYDLIDE